MDVRVILKPFPSGIVRYVEQLSSEILFIADAMFVITGVPDSGGTLMRERKGVATFDELNASCRADVDCGRNQHVDMVRQDGEAMKGKLSSVAIAEERGDEELCVFGSLEVSVAVQGQNSDCIGAERLAGRGHS
jgi:hypothetical protein